MGGSFTHFDSSTIFRDAEVAHGAGLCVVPPEEDGSKKPGRAWKQYQQRRPTETELAHFYTERQRTGIGAICGEPSGNLECLEFDDAATYQTFRSTAEAVGLGELVARIEAGCSDATPGGGVHWYVRCSEIGSNTALAKRPAPTPANPHYEKTLIETRGRGGYVIMAPSNGRVHPSGKPYVRLAGGPATITTITPEERRALFDLARAFDERPPREIGSTLSANGPSNDLRPGDDYNARFTDWRTILEPAGWTLVFERSGMAYWRRPGKDRGVSATTNWDGRGKFRVFTSSTAFEPAMYSPFAAYAVLHHGGDYRAAARDLARQGFGSRREEEGADPTLSTSGAPAEAKPLPPPPVFPVEVLPSAIRAYVSASAKSIGVPDDMVAVPMLVLAGATIGNRLFLRLKAGYHQYPSLFAAIIAPPGSAKSPAQLAAQWPLNKLQAEAHETYQSQLTAWEAEIERWQARPKEERGEKPIRPRLEHFYTSDVTIEALVSIMERSPGVAIIRDEVSGLVASFDQYRGGKGSDRQQYLSLWAGAPIKADRRTGEPVFVAHPVAGIVGGIPPDQLPLLHTRSGQRDGFVERFLLIRPHVEPVGWTDDETDPALLDPVVETFRRLRRIPPPDRDKGGHAVELHPDARRLWADWYSQNDALRHRTAGLRQGFYAKLPNHVARLALILSTVWNADEDVRRMVSAERIADAIELGEYIRAHLDRVLPLLGDGSAGATAGLTGRILRILRTEATEDNGGWVRRSTIINRLRNVPTDELSVALESLREANEVESRTAPDTTTKPAEEWRVKPLPPFGDSEYSENLGESPNTPSNMHTHSTASEEVSRGCIAPLACGQLGPCGRSVAGACHAQEAAELMPNARWKRHEEGANP